MSSPTACEPADRLLAALDYALPAELIARRPPPERDGGRLLQLGADRLVDRDIRDLPALLQPGDLLVVNDTRVLPARLFARRSTGGRVELLLLPTTLQQDEEGRGALEAMLRPGRRLSPGERLAVLDHAEQEPVGAVELVARLEGGSWRLRPEPDLERLLEAAGHVPLPPYLGRADDAEDRRRYQTVYAGPAGAVAAPTAGLHLSERLLAALDERGVERAVVTLHVGPGTFRPLRPQDLVAGRLHSEPWTLPAATVAAVARTRARGGRVVAVGTTATRVLESAAGPGGALIAGQGDTELFIRPGSSFRVVDRLLTNLHLPGSSLLALVQAFAGVQRVQAAYAHAVAARYRFYSYGDAMLLDLDPPRSAP